MLSSVGLSCVSIVIFNLVPGGWKMNSAPFRMDTLGIRTVAHPIRGSGMRAFTIMVGLAGFLSRGLAAQEMPADSMTHKPTFLEGDPRGWTFGPPHLDLNAGLLLRSGGTGPAVREGFVRFHVQFALGASHLVSTSDVLFLPGVGATPIFTSVFQVQPLRPDSWLFLGAGLGVTTGHGGSKDRLSGHVQGTVAFRLPIHEIGLFAQVSKALRRGERGELLLGIAHPIAPYRHHFF